jgi:hypothetical protein
MTVRVLGWNLLAAKGFDGKLDIPENWGIVAEYQS